MMTNEMRVVWFAQTIFFGAIIYLSVLGTRSLFHEHPEPCDRGETKLVNPGLNWGYKKGETNYPEYYEKKPWRIPDKGYHIDQNNINYI